jgi:hypothetical protein
MALRPRLAAGLPFRGIRAGETESFRPPRKDRLGMELCQKIIKKLIRFRQSGKYGQTKNVAGKSTRTSCFDLPSAIHPLAAAHGRQEMNLAIVMDRFQKAEPAKLCVHRHRYPRAQIFAVAQAGLDSWILTFQFFDYLANSFAPYRYRILSSGEIAHQ